MLSPLHVFRTRLWRLGAIASIVITSGSIAAESKHADTANAQAHDKAKSKPAQESELERRLLSAEKIELFSLVPEFYQLEYQKAVVEQHKAEGRFPVVWPKDHPKFEEMGFHGHKVLGSVVVKNPTVRRQVAQQLIRSFRESSPGAECFEPHHGVRLYDKDTTADLVICFDCGRKDTYGVDNDLPGVGAHVPPLLYTLFRRYDIPYEGPRPPGMEDEETTGSRHKPRN
jgi:hypothetical protein